MTAGAKVDAYAILGVERSASAAEIRAAYRAQVARYHPDRHQGNPLEELASQRMVEINQAYEVLSDPARRAAFDRGGAPERAAGGAAGAAGRSVPRPGLSSNTRWALLILVLPLLVRSGAGILRALAGLMRVLFGALEGFSGTPAALILAATAVTLLVLALAHRRRTRR